MTFKSGDKVMIVGPLDPKWHYYEEILEDYVGLVGFIVEDSHSYDDCIRVEFNDGNYWYFQAANIALYDLDVLEPRTYPIELKPGYRIQTAERGLFIVVPKAMSSQQDGNELIGVWNGGWIEINFKTSTDSTEECYRVVAVYDVPECHKEILNVERKGKRLWKGVSPEAVAIIEQLNKRLKEIENE